jgi:adenosylcobinamide kinase/adenosylcobinamide-phosphate guanylyltransferase
MTVETKAADGRPRFVLVGGGARSGKSRFALGRAAALGRRRLYIATAEASDDEMRDRIARPRAERAGAFDTLEEPLALPEVLAGARGYDVLLVDCLTLWLSNLLVRGVAVPEARLEALAAALAGRSRHVVLVSNEVGMGLVPETPLGRVFRDVAGLAHQRLARDADEIHVGVLGLILRLRPGPVTVEDAAP